MTRPATIYGLLKTTCAFCRKTFKGPSAHPREKQYPRCAVYRAAVAAAEAARKEDAR